MNWHTLSTSEQWQHVVEASHITPQLVFKHSTRCIISRSVLNRLETEWSFGEDQIVSHYLDLLTYRPISNLIAESTGVYHQSPQAIVIDKGRVIYHDSHDGINAEAIAASLAKK